MSEYPRRFLAGATQLDEKTRWSTPLRRIFWYFLRWIAPDREPSHPATGGLTAESRINCSVPMALQFFCLFLIVNQ